MSWDDYEVFCRVAESGGFSAAAKTMQRSKSSISIAVSRLETELGVRLLERSTRLTHLTEAGESLYSHLKPLFAQLNDARDEVVNYSKAIRGMLRIAAPYEFSAHHLGGVACTLMAQHPALHIQIDTEYALINPLDDRYDIVFSMVNEGMPSSSLVARRVYSLEQGLFASPDLLTSCGRPTRAQELGELPVIASSEGNQWGYFTGKGARRVVRFPEPRLRSSNADVRLQAAVAGLGVVRLTATYCSGALDKGLLEKVLPRYRWAPISVYALLPTRRLIPAKVRLFLDALETHADTG